MTPIQETKTFRLAASLSDDIYRLVSRWPLLAQKTVGEQLIRAADSIGANLVEGDGRGSDADSVRYFRYSRSSAREALFFIERAIARELMEVDTGQTLARSMEELIRMTSGLVAYRENHGLGRRVRETTPTYSVQMMSKTAENRLYPEDL